MNFFLFSESKTPNGFLDVSSLEFALKNVFIIESLIVPDATPILKSPMSVLMMYFASLPDAEVSSSEINESFLSTVPLPSSSGSFLMFSRTFLVVIFSENNVFCFFLFMICSATFPKSPSFFQCSIIMSDESPDALLNALMQSFSDIPSSFSE